MTRSQLSELKVGDKCVITRAYDAGRKCEVVYMNREDDIILVRSADGKSFNSRNNYARNHRLINWRDLSRIEEA